MIRKIIEDIKPKNRNAKNISVKKITETKKVKTREVKNKTQISTKKDKRRLPDTFKPKIKPKLIRNSFSIIIIVIFIIGLLFGGASLFEKATVYITKKTQVFNLVNDQYKAYKDSSSLIPFDIMIISDEKTENIQLEESKEVSIKAKGEVIIYNEYSQKSEKLSSGTYLSDENGKVYLTDRAISVPGYKKEGQSIIPGQVRVDVTSFLPGEVYNGEPSDFSINAFKGTSKYEKIYGKAKTVMTGGAQGTYYTLKDVNKDNISEGVYSSLKKSLINKVSSLIPANYLFYPNASKFSYEINNNILSPKPNAEIKVSGTLIAVLLKEDELIRAIKKRYIPNIEDGDLDSVSISGINNLSFNFSDTDQDLTKNLNYLNFNLSGDLLFTWNPDINKLLTRLIGLPKENLVNIFREDTSIDNATVKIFPPWKSVLPNKESNIKINVL